MTRKLLLAIGLFTLSAGSAFAAGKTHTTTRRVAEAPAAGTPAKGKHHKGGHHKGAKAKDAEKPAEAAPAK